MMHGWMKGKDVEAKVPALYYFRAISRGQNLAFHTHWQLF